MQNKGEVFVQVFVDEDGYVADVAILQSSGDSLLDLATQVGFSNCKYLPIYKEGKPTKFSLQDSYNWQQRVEASKNQMGMGVEFKFTDSQLEIGCVQSITDRCFIRLYDKKCYMPSRSKDFNSLCNAPQHEFILNVGQKEKISSASELGLPCASEQKYKSLDECIDRK
jgi:TonB family protein